MSSVYKLIYHKEALKFIAKQEKSMQERIAEGLKGLLVVPPVGDIRPMKGNFGLYRLRIGTYRVIFEIDHDEKIIFVRAVGSRGDIYK
ncbi:plasmid stabilization protein [Paenibacillus dendritiformis]|uniref:type II toxin-antitoxin system RelE family toxin n=1 Tax=Paenibacillus dendritiformis TaxID=130049 RepID=UPI0018CE8410|nr:type II toxin-antitoxin system RelE/ParE family toxin [Paenibacillus dendritiformis]MBG9794830.1 plasmid stabilization protein [Paenibacillus dendritiformis]MBG9795242.1 plasmid stabilization protein [Paenibacillus dendritiformis]MBG9796064.1 plasmid stabilization protein [Paenibacillus dendritiformis]